MATDNEDWHLICFKNGTPKPLLANAITAFRNAPDYQGALGYDAFAQQTMLIDGDYAEPWSDQNDIMAANWLQKHGIEVSPAVTAQAVELVARDRSYHPVRNYLDSLTHDGTSRLDTMLSKYFGAENNAYTVAVGRNFMIGAVARIFQPGCKNDDVPIFEGEQGALKSTALKLLFDPWFTDDIETLGSKDSAMQCAGVWCIEIAELDSMTKVEVTKVKGFVTRTHDRFRPPYGRRVIERPRQCVFAGTTNKHVYLRDETGARRYLPVAAAKIDVEGLRRDRDRLWAEAYALYRAGTPWWFTNTEAAAMAKDEQEGRYEVDAWEELLSEYLRNLRHDPPDYIAYQVDIQILFRHALRIEDRGRWDQASMNRIARCLRRLGWRRKQVRISEAGENMRVWKYVRRPTDDELELDAHQQETQSQRDNVTNIRRPSPDAAE